MTSESPNDQAWPKLHNAAWPGVVGKEPGSDQPPIDLETMIELTADAEVDGARFDGLDLFLSAPHIDIDSSHDDLAQWADKFAARNLVVGSVVAPVWPPAGGGSAIGDEAERKQFLVQVRKACGIAKQLRELNIRPYGVVRIDSAAGPAEWAEDPQENTKRLVHTFREAAHIAADHGERLAAEGEICWGGMHSWRKMVDVLEQVDRPATLGFQADMAHTLLYTLGYNAPEDALLPEDFDWTDGDALDVALAQVAAALRPWTIDFHVAQNDGTVFGSGSHDRTGRHCLPNDPNGRLDVPRHASLWLRGDDGQPTGVCRHICWDGCMFPNEVMQESNTWNQVLRTMLAVRAANSFELPDA